MKMLKAKTAFRGAEDDNNCTVLSFAHALGWSYSLAFEEFMFNARRRHNQAVSLGDCQRVYAGISHLCLHGYYGEFQCLNAGRKAYSEDFVDCTLEDFINNHPKGRFIVHVKGHAAAVVDGELWDAYDQPAAQSVVAVWRVLV